MRTSRLIAAVVLGLLGLLWLAQGVGIVGGSAMTGSSFWAIVGIVLIAAAVVVVLCGRRSTAS